MYPITFGLYVLVLYVHENYIVIINITFWYNPWNSWKVYIMEGSLRKYFVVYLSVYLIFDVKSKWEYILLGI